MIKIKALVAAAGRGTRAGLPYPKTLFPIKGLPILVRIAHLVRPYDQNPIIVVSPDGKGPIEQCTRDYSLNAQLVLQYEPRGMGDAVLRFKDSADFEVVEHVLLIWGDIPFIQSSTLDAVVDAHLQHQNDFTFATRVVEDAYTVVSRDQQGAVLGVFETRELGGFSKSNAERDIGLFIFRKQLVFDALEEEVLSKFGKTTGEHGFLYVIEHLVKKGYRVEALPVATEMDLVSLNSLKDLHDYL